MSLIIKSILCSIWPEDLSLPTLLEIKHLFYNILSQEVALIEREIIIKNMFVFLGYIMFVFCVYFAFLKKN